MKSVLKELKKGKSFLVCSHLGPDGDAMASMLALGLGLEQFGKKVVYYNNDSVPENLRFLPGAGKAVQTLNPKDYFDAAIAVDCGSVHRLGERFLNFQGYNLLINIDHHASNDRYGDLNYILPKAASSGEVVWQVLKALKCKLTPKIAMNIYCTLVTDTGSFRYSNTTASTLRLAAEMVEAGAEPSTVSQNLFESHPRAVFALLKRLLDRLEISQDGRYSWSVLYKKDLLETGSNYEMTEEFINYPRAIKGVEIAMLFKEWEGGSFKVSMRSKAAADVSEICQSFGGGGHQKASACIVPGTFEEVKKKIIEKVEELLK
ncbi:MAG: bifunctional oligoribonuclease/PAP phosphatase NrnA [Deltaproteobacteria bacterium]